MAGNKCTMQQRALPELPENVLSVFGHIRALLGAFGHFRALPGCARKCPKATESAQKCTKTRRAFSGSSGSARCSI
eukprot:1230408-Alexandrium_andersonii.AAC.1